MTEPVAVHRHLLKKNGHPLTVKEEYESAPEKVTAQVRSWLDAFGLNTMDVVSITFNGDGSYEVVRLISRELLDEYQMFADDGGVRVQWTPEFQAKIDRIGSDDKETD